MLASCRMWCPATNSKIAATTPRANRRRASPSNVALFMSVPAFVGEAMLPPRRREWLGRWVAPPLAIEKGSVPLDLRVVKRHLQGHLHAQPGLTLSLQEVSCALQRGCNVARRVAAEGPQDGCRFD